MARVTLIDVCTLFQSRRDNIITGLGNGGFNIVNIKFLVAVIVDVDR